MCDLDVEMVFAMVVTSNIMYKNMISSIVVIYIYIKNIIQTHKAV